MHPVVFPADRPRQVWIRRTTDGRRTDPPRGTHPAAAAPLRAAEAPGRPASAASAAGGRPLNPPQQPRREVLPLDDRSHLFGVPELVPVHADDRDGPGDVGDEALVLLVEGAKCLWRSPPRPRGCACECAPCPLQCDVEVDDEVGATHEVGHVAEQVEVGAVVALVHQIDPPASWRRPHPRRWCGPAQLRHPPMISWCCWNRRFSR